MDFATLRTHLADAQNCHAAAIDSLRQTLAAAAQRAFELNALAVSTALEEGAETSKTLVQAKDMEEALRLSQELTAPTFEKLAGLAHNAHEIASDTGAEVLKVADREVALIDRQMNQLAEFMNGDSPLASASAASLITGLTKSSQLALDGAWQSAVQACEWAETCLAALDAAAMSFGATVREAAKEHSKAVSA